jgi:hypothetical protein
MMRALALLALTSCSDPVQSTRIEALGSERSGVAKGPLHRPGQPCVLCHDGSGPRAFSVAGTVYSADGSSAAAAGVRVELTDSTGATFTTASNCAGNFFVEPADFTPLYPMWVALETAGERIEMDTPVARDGSCASCHARESSAASPGVVYAFAGAAPERAACP